MDKWEYKMVTLKKEEAEKELNSLGVQGWEAVAMYHTPSSNYSTVLLKRRLS
jgi:hypothetical protein